MVSIEFPDWSVFACYFDCGCVYALRATIHFEVQSCILSGEEKMSCEFLMFYLPVVMERYDKRRLSMLLTRS